MTFERACFLIFRKAVMRLITSVDELLHLPGDPAVNGFGRRLTLRLEIPGISRRSLFHAQRRFNRLQARCGCVAGSITMLVTLVAGAAYIYVDNTGNFSWRILPQAAALLLTTFVLGFAAKMTTLAMTRWQFARSCRLQHRAWSDLVQQPR